MQTVIISLMLTTLAIAQEEAASKYNFLTPAQTKASTQVVKQLLSALTDSH